MRRAHRRPRLCSLWFVVLTAFRILQNALTSFEVCIRYSLFSESPLPVFCSCVLLCCVMGLAAICWNIMLEWMLRDLHKSWKWGSGVLTIHQSSSKIRPGVLRATFWKQYFQDLEKFIPWLNVFNMFVLLGRFGMPSYCNVGDRRHFLTLAVGSNNF